MCWSNFSFSIYTYLLFYIYLMNIILMHSLLLQRTLGFDDAESSGMDLNNAFSILRHVAKRQTCIPFMSVVNNNVVRRALSSTFKMEIYVKCFLFNLRKKVAFHYLVEH